MNTLQPHSYAFGRAFENFLITEVMRLSDSYELDLQLSYLRTKDGVEIDLIIEQKGHPTYLIEIESSDRVDASALLHLRSLSQKFGSTVNCRCWSLDPKPRMIDGIEVLPWKMGLKEVIG